MDLPVEINKVFSYDPGQIKTSPNPCPLCWKSFSPDEDGLGVEFPVSCGLIGKGDQVSQPLLIFREHSPVEVVLHHVDGRHRRQWCAYYRFVFF